MRPRLPMGMKVLVVFVGNWKVKGDWRSTDVRLLTANRIGAPSSSKISLSSPVGRSS